MLQDKKGCKIHSISWLWKLAFGGVERRAHEVTSGISERFSTALLYADTLASKRPSQDTTTFITKKLYLPFNPYSFSARYKNHLERFFLLKVKKYLLKQKGNFIVYGQGVNGWPGISIGAPTIIDVHGSTKTDIKRDLSKCSGLGITFKETLSKTDIIVAITRSSADSLVSFGYSANKIEVIYNGVDVDLYVNADKLVAMKMFNLSPEKKYLLAVFNFSPVKRLDAMLDIFKEFKEEHPNYEFILCGKGIEEHVAKKTVDTQKLKGITFLGFQDKLLPHIYKLADMVINVSKTESFPVVYLEAMAAGVPVIAPGHQGSLELLKNEVNSLVHEPLDDKQCLRNIKRLANDRTLHQELSLGAIETVKQFDLKCVVEKYCQLIEKISHH